MNIQSNEVSLAARERVFSAARAAVTQAGFGLCAFLFARQAVFGAALPFGTALCAAAPKGYMAICAAAAAAGYISSGQPDSFRYVAAVIIITLVRWLCEGFLKKASAQAGAFILDCSVMTLCTAITLSVAGFSGIELLSGTAEALFSATVALFMARFFSVAASEKKLRALSSQDLACAVISFAVLVLSLSGLTVASVSPARVIMLFAVMLCALYGHESAGAVAGTAAGLVMALSGDGYLFAAAGFPLAGLMAGIFSPTGKLSTAAAFVLTNGIVALRAASEPALIPVLYEVAAASVLFVALPVRLSGRFSELFSPCQSHDDSLRSNLIMRLRFASFALCDVSKTVDKVAEGLKKVSSPELEDAIKKSECAVCGHCTLRIYCWETNRKATLEAVMRAVELFSKGVEAAPGDLNEGFVKRCSHPEELLNTLSVNYSRYRSRLSAEKRVSEIRGVVSQQFEGISCMLDNLAGEFEDFETYDNETAERIRSALIACRVVPDEISCRCDRFGRMTAEICIPSPDERINRSILKRELSLVCDRDFDVPCVTRAEDKTLLTLTESAVYSVDFGVSQIVCEGNRLCGDAFEQFNDGKGHSVMILSDGMGSGGRAAVDGAMAAGLMSRLIKAGFGYDCALDIVNSAMLFKSGDESLATVDIAVTDLFSGYTDIYKAGAPATVIRKNKKAMLCSGSSLPPGIVRDVAFDKSGVTLSEGDIIVMMSDGAQCDGIDWIAVEAEVCRDMTAQQLAEHIADYAHRRETPGHSDDITILTAIINKA